MPELPEVETTVRDLNKKVLGRTFIDVWTDFKNIVKKPKPSTRAKLGAGPVPHRNEVSGAGSLEEFKNQIKGRKIQRIWRRGKNILLDLSKNKTLLIHQKLTGHLLLGQWVKKKGRWQAKTPGPLAEDLRNRFLHLIFWLDSGEMLALSDLRKFAKIELLDQKELKKELSSFGPEPLEKNFTFEKFKEALSKKKKGKIKQILMDQEIIAGIGNIYSDEILWTAKIHPFKEVSNLSEAKLKKIYMAIKKILPLAIELKGESFSDFRRLSGEKGYFDKARKVYRRAGEKCSRCDKIIKRVKLAGRSAHFCPKCQPI